MNKSAAMGRKVYRSKRERPEAIEQMPESARLPFEQAILNYLLIGEGYADDIISRVPLQAFSADFHQALYSLMIDMHERKERIDIVTVLAEMALRWGPQEGMIGPLEGRRAYVVDLVATEWFPPSQRDYYLRRLLSYHAKETIATAHELAAEKLIEADASEVAAVVSETKLELIDAEQSLPTIDPPTVAKVLTAIFEEVEAKTDRPELYAGTRTGFAAIDRLLGGLQGGELHIVAGRPGMGKSAFAGTVALNVARPKENGGEGRTAAVFSLEMSQKQYLARLWCAEAEIDTMRLKYPHKMQTDEWERFCAAMGRLYELPLHVDDSYDPSLTGIVTKARKIASQEDLALIVVDYLQLVESGGRRDNRTQEVSEVARGLKNLALSLDVPVIALAQLNRAVETRDKKRPVLADLRESGEIEASADTVMLLYREAYYDQAKRAEVEETEVILAKNRNGATGTIRVGFKPRFAQFVNLTNPYLAGGPQ